MWNLEVPEFPTLAAAAEVLGTLGRLANPVLPANLGHLASPVLLASLGLGPLLRDL